MVTGKTSSGFEFTINEGITTDWRVAKAIAKTQSKDETEQVQGAVEIVSRLLGDQEEALCNHIEKDGIVPTSDLIKEVSEIMEIASQKNAEVKN